MQIDKNCLQNSVISILQLDFQLISLILYQKSHSPLAPIYNWHVHQWFNAPIPLPLVSQREGCGFAFATLSVYDGVRNALPFIPRKDTRGSKGCCLDRSKKQPPGSCESGG